MVIRDFIPARGTQHVADVSQQLVAKTKRMKKCFIVHFKNSDNLVFVAIHPDKDEHVVLKWVRH